MKPIRVVIVDDEPDAIDVIEELCSQLAEDLIIEGTATNGVDAAKTIIKVKPDLIFLDVDMPMMNGLQMLEKLPTTNFEIVFTTGSSSYALRAIKLNAIDYLLKPIDPADFIVAVEKTRQVIAMKKGAALATPMVRKIQLHTQQGITYLDETEILYISGMGSYCVINTTSSEKIIVSKSIGQIYEKLSETHFFRCHNSQIVNLNFISKFSSKDGYSVIMKDGTPVEVSRRSKDKLLDLLASRSDL